MFHVFLRLKDISFGNSYSPYWSIFSSMGSLDTFEFHYLLVHVACFNTILPTEYLMSNRDLFLKVLEAMEYKLRKLNSAKERLSGS